MNTEIPKPNTAQSAEKLAIRARRRIDPILQELYDIKAELNAEAGYSVQKVLELARRNIELALAEADVFVPVIAIPEEILESLK